MKSSCVQQNKKSYLRPSFLYKDHAETAAEPAVLEKTWNPGYGYRRREPRSLVGETRRQTVDTHWRDDPNCRV